MKRPPPQSAEPPASRDPLDPDEDIILLEDLAPRVDVKGGAIVFGQHHATLPSTLTRRPNDTARGRGSGS